MADLRTRLCSGDAGGCSTMGTIMGLVMGSLCRAPSIAFFRALPGVVQGLPRRMATEASPQPPSPLRHSVGLRWIASFQTLTCKFPDSFSSSKFHIQSAPSNSHRSLSSAHNFIHIPHPTSHHEPDRGRPRPPGRFPRAPHPPTPGITAPQGHQPQSPIDRLLLPPGPHIKGA